MAKIHIDENVVIKMGKEAEEALVNQNDISFLTKDGVNKISHERWELAQSTEKKHWMELGAKSADDRNYEHAFSFNNYTNLKGLTFRRAAEFGCGPFTNIRVISHIAKIEKCVLIDPLANEYLNHEFCTYIGGRFLRNDMDEAISIQSIMPIKGEEVPDNLDCDLVICINVLEHCYDAELFLNKLFSSCSKGGFIVFHDRVYDYDNAKQSVENIYDAAHPLRVGKDLIESFLSKLQQVHRVDLSIRNEMTNTYQDSIYFIGRKE